MATDTSFGRVRFFDDFLDDTLDDNAWTIDDITGGTNFVIAEAVNGTAVGTAHTSAGQGVLLHGTLDWQADDGGPLIFETRVKLGVTLSSLIFVGFTDEKTGEMPMDYNGGSLTTTADDAAGIYMAGGETGYTWRCGGTANTVDSTQTAADSKYNPVSGTYQTFRVVVNENGYGSFFINGDLIVENVAGCLTVGTSVMPCLQVCEDAVASGTLTADYVYVSKGRV